ncbi:Putative HNH nuclease [Colletotrichum destructivum]|uniref:HNH nuclease n=1 Tax=Colletotrichum destructivum TaxID=34406 RepID=A0AAX4ID65_9PEZI|nr:Putative HNH nuclease [Colletotrichum destructivum]
MGRDIDYFGENLVERLGLIRRIRKMCLAKNTETNERDRGTLSQATLWSLLLIIDMTRLRKIASDLEEDGDAKEDTLFRLPEVADGVQEMVWYCKPHAPNSFQFFYLLINRYLVTKGPIFELGDEEMINRNASLARAACQRLVDISTARYRLLTIRQVLERDGMHCVLTGHNNPEVCHIWPFWAVNRKDQADDSLKALALVFGMERILELREKLADKESNTVEKPGNMITLSGELQRLWEEDFLALEPIGPVFKPAHVPTTSSTGEEGTAKETSTPANRAKNDPKEGLREKASDRLMEKKKERDAEREIMHIEGVKLRFHWLKRTTHESMYSILGPDAELNPRKMWKDWEDNIVVHDVDGRPLENGHVLGIFPTSQAEAPDMEILRLRWDVLRMHALTGGADPVLYAPDDDYEDGRRVSVDRPKKVRALEALKDNQTEANNH